MRVTGIRLEGYRNFENEYISFGDGVNIITGKNAQGKTNLIEAIYYLATGKSFRSASDKEIIGFENTEASIKAEFFSEKREQNVEARFKRGSRRQLFANNVKLKKASELSGRLSAVVFCPDDLCLIKDGASSRRKLMDNAISQLKPGYVTALSEFNRIYDHKTRILRDHFEKPSLLELLDDFNLQLARHSAQLIYYRSAFSTSLARKAKEIHSKFSAGSEELRINYSTVGGMEHAGLKPSQLMPALLEHQERHREAEIRSGLCLSGAHKDDLEIEINGNNARKYASQGQARTASVSIKLAERDIHCESRGEHPILLLDDVLSELDAKRQEYVLGSIEEGQVFITCCDDSFFTKLKRKKPTDSKQFKVIKIENGRVVNA